MPVTIIKYACSVCGTVYKSAAAAELCESSPELEPCPVRPGDKVRVYELHRGQKRDVVQQVTLAPTALTGLLKYHTKWLCWPFDRQFHCWKVRVKQHHQVTKDEDGYTNTVTLDQLAVDRGQLLQKG